MRPIGALAVAFSLALCGFAQQHSSSGSVHAAASRPAAPVREQAATGTSGNHVVYPPAGVANPGTGVVTNPNFIPSLASTVNGQVGGHSPYHRFRHGGPGPYAYAYPVYIGGYGNGYGYPDSGYVDNGGYQGGYATDPAEGPQVIMNPNFVPEHANPVMRDYSPDSSGVQVYDAPGRAPLDSNDDGTNYYLIAFKDHSIYSAFAYWVDGDTLHYVTPQRVHNQVSVALVDRELTDKLNRGRAMQVKLPN